MWQIWRRCSVLQCKKGLAVFLLQRLWLAPLSSSPPSSMGQEPQGGALWLHKRERRQGPSFDVPYSSWHPLQKKKKKKKDGIRLCVRKCAHTCVCLRQMHCPSFWCKQQSFGPHSLHLTLHSLFSHLQLDLPIWSAVLVCSTGYFSGSVWKKAQAVFKQSMWFGLRKRVRVCAWERKVRGRVSSSALNGWHAWPSWSPVILSAY